MTLYYGFKAINVMKFYKTLDSKKFGKIVVISIIKLHLDNIQGVS
jgi:hypothetical protein